MATMEEILKGIEQGVTIAATAAEAAAPIVALVNPGAAMIMSVAAPAAESFLLKGAELVIQFNKDMTPEQMVAALQASLSANWPEPPSIDVTH